MPEDRGSGTRVTEAEAGVGAILPIDELSTEGLDFSEYGGAEVTVNGERIVVFNANVLAELIVGARTSAQGLLLPIRDRATAPNDTAERVAQLVAAVDAVQAEQASAARSELLKAMFVADIDPVPGATVAQAHRLARQRHQLLASGAHTIESLGELRGDTAPSATRTWLTRKRKSAQLFTVTHDGAALLPAFQLDAEGQPRPEVGAVLEALAPAEMSPWATWTWFTSTSAWLGGAKPVDLLDTEPERVATAARRFASNAA